MNLQILHEDTHIIVCHKPARIATQSCKIGEPDMVSILKNHIYKSSSSKNEPYLAVIHRLDQPVEGLLVFAKTPFAAKELNKQLQNHGFSKQYLALLCGQPKESALTLEDYILKDGRTNTSCICSPDTPGAKKAILHYEILNRHEDTPTDTTWVKIKLETGRHHQIRVQMAHMGCPLWGDTKYNTFHQEQQNWTQIKLYANKLSFLHPKTKKIMEFELEL